MPSIFVAGLDLNNIVVILVELIILYLTYIRTNHHPLFEQFEVAHSYYKISAAIILHYQIFKLLQCSITYLIVEAKTTCEVEKGRHVIAMTKTENEHRAGQPVIRDRKDRNLRVRNDCGV